MDSCPQPRGSPVPYPDDAAFWPGALLPIALVCLVLVVIWGSIFLHLSEQRRETLARASRSSANLADAAAAETARTIAGIDQAMLLLRTAYLRAPVAFDIRFWADQATAAEPAVLSYSIADSAGRVIESSLGSSVRSVDISSLKVVREQLDTHEDKLLISVPVMDQLVHRRCIEFTRPIIGAGGEPLGVFVLAADPARLSALYGRLKLGHGSFELVGLDGIVRADGPIGEAAIGRDISGNPLFAEARHRESGTVVSSDGLAGTEQISSFQRVMGYPVFVVVGLNAGDVFGPWNLYRRQYLAGGAVLSVLTLVIGALLLRSRSRLLRSRRDLVAAVENIGQGLIMVSPQGRVLLANRRAADLLGGVPPFLSVPLKSGEHEDRRANGRILEVRTQELRDGGAVRTYSDITERRKGEEHVLYLARHDVLTGLGNRVLLDERLDALVNEPRERERGFAVLLLDLDRFRIVNASFGHAAGDIVLVELGKRLRLLGREGDVAARTGGDEFVILLRGIADREAAGRQADRVLGLISEPLCVGHDEIFLSASLGLALFPAHGTSATELLHRAQAALDQAKNIRRGSWQVFGAEMDVVIQRRRIVERDLRAAIGTPALSLHYQPRVRLTDGAVTCFEALLRWTHPVHGDIEPGVFVPIAEESGLIHDLGAWVLHSACLEAKAWPEPVRVAVNVSISQVRSPELTPLIVRVLAETGLPGGRLELEMTESLLMEDAERTRATLQELRAMGVRLALDDFGTGYSSPGYLLAFPFDEIKIDQSFIARLVNDSSALAIVQAIIAMARGLDMRVTAEGVETAEQLRILRRLGCGAVQGFLLGRPLPAGSVVGVLAQISEKTG